MQILDRNRIFQINESFSTDSQIWIHFPITGDLVKCNILESTRTKVLLTMPEDSDLFGCPPFWFNKTNIIGKA